MRTDEGISTSIVSGNPCWVCVPRQSLKPMTLKPKAYDISNASALPRSLPFKVRTQSLLFWTSPFQVFAQMSFSDPSKQFGQNTLRFL